MRKSMLLHFILCLFSAYFLTVLMAEGSFEGSKQGCERQCGNVTVPYPFGIGKDSGCSLDDNRFYLTCKSSKLFLQDSTVQVYNISDSELRIFTGVSYRCYNSSGGVYQEFNWWTSLSWIFTFSEKNKFTVVGCDDSALITGEDGADFSSGCFGLCSNPSDVPDDGKCSGKGCCQTSIAKGLQYYNVTLDTLNNHSAILDDNDCGLAFLGEEGSFQFGGAQDLYNSTALFDRVTSTVPVVLDWVIAPDRSNCSDGRDTVCKGISSCLDVDGGGYRCTCKQGYEGNPYLESGCQDIDECKYPGTIPCHGRCINTIGNYTCTCPQGSSGNPNTQNGCVKDSKYSSVTFIIGMGFAFLGIFIGISMLYFTAKKRKLIKLREKFFEQNGGALLEDKLRTMGVSGSIKIFQVEEIKEATDNFSEDTILGRGGNGTVYKGTLPDTSLVAIKMSQRLDQAQREQFINEMVILAQINHQNVVQLLGCCLETDVPLLAYEYISNDTLHHHIHDKKTGTPRLSWDSRLRIAHESAGALAYLHTDARMSIIHRDVKSTNILLDENYTAKIADFGASRLIPLGHDQVTTLVQGTFGYLDPEYFHTGQLTDKSDVYSFGVVLAELLTGQQPLNSERCLEERNLATYFLKEIKGDQFLHILEPGVVNEGTYEQLKAISGLVCRCLNQVGGNRPSMKEVTMELETLRKLGKHHDSVISEDNYNQMSSLMIEMEPSTDLYTVPLMPNTDTFGNNSCITEMQDMMLHLQNAR